MQPLLSRKRQKTRLSELSAPGAFHAESSEGLLEPWRLDCRQLLRFGWTSIEDLSAVILRLRPLLETEGIVQFYSEASLGRLEPVEFIFLPIMVQHDEEFVARF
jgi:hypothetical protein